MKLLFFITSLLLAGSLYASLPHYDNATGLKRGDFRGVIVAEVAKQ